MVHCYNLGLGPFFIFQFFKFKVKFIDFEKFKFMKISRADSNSLHCETFNFTYFQGTNAKFKLEAKLATFKSVKPDNLDMISRYSVCLSNRLLKTNIFE